MTEQKESCPNKLTGADEVKLVIEIFKNHRDEINLKNKEYGKQTNYLLAILSLFPTVFAIYIQSTYAQDVFLKSINKYWGLTFGVIFSFHFVALFLAAKVAAEQHFIMLNAHVLKIYESIISSYLPEKAEIRWERYWSPEHGFATFPYKNLFILNPNYLAAIAIFLFVIILNISSLIIAYQANNKWYFITFVIPLMWIYMAYIHFYVCYGLFNWEKKPINRDLKSFLLWLFLALYILIFFTAGYENVLLRPDLTHRVLNVYAVFPGDFLLIISAYFFLKLNKYGCFRKIKTATIVLVGIVSLIIPGVQHFLIWIKDNIPGFIDPNITHMGITGYVHFFMEFIGIFLWGLMVFQFDRKKFNEVSKGRKTVSIGFIFFFLYIMCMFFDFFKPGGNLLIPSLLFLIELILMFVVLRKQKNKKI